MFNWLRKASQEPMTYYDFAEWLKANEFEHHSEIGPNSFRDLKTGSHIGLYNLHWCNFDSLRDELLRIRADTVRGPRVGDVVNIIGGGSATWNGSEYVNDCPVCRRRELAERAARSA